MARKKKYTKIKGEKDFLVLTLICAVLCVWSIRDGWFPSNKVIKKHPKELMLSFDTGGLVHEVNVKEGESIREGVVLAKLSTSELDEKLKTLEAEYAAARDAAKEELSAEKYQEILQLRDVLLASTLKLAKGYQIELDEHRVPQITGKVWDEKDPDYKKCYLLKEKSMVVKQILIKRYRQVVSSEPAIVLNTKDHFYPFNKVLAVIAGIGFVVFGILHILVSKD